MECPDYEVSILLVDDVRIEEMNRKYLGKSGPTNVISFSMTEGEFGGINPHLLGDVVVSVETAKRQALEGKVSLGEMVDFLLIHGLLHLLGYDHERSSSEAEIMEAKEKELMKNLSKTWHPS